MSGYTKLGDGRIAFLSSGTPEAEDARVLFVKRYGETDCADADVIVALGGDGLMLQTLHRFMGSKKPIYGMNRGSVGFLMNEYQEDNLRERLAAALVSTIHPLTMKATDVKGDVHEARAINEVSLLRQTYQAAKLLAQDSLFQRMAGVVQNQASGRMVHGDVDAGDLAHFVVIRDRRHGPLVRFQYFNGDAGLVRQQRPAPATRAKSRDRRQRHQRRIERQDRAIGRKVVGG